MQIITLHEIIDIIITIFFVGFLIKDFFKVPHKQNYDPLVNHQSKKYEDLKFAIYLTAPAIILHEMGHKFVAMSFGIPAVFHAFYANSFTFTIGIIAFFMKLVGGGFVLLVPGFVSIAPIATTSQMTMIAFAGPFVNLVLWLGSAFFIKNGMVGKKYLPLAILTSKVNMFLFIFNMLPIPGFDGSKVFSGLFGMLF